MRPPAAIVGGAMNCYRKTATHRHFIAFLKHAFGSGLLVGHSWTIAVLAP